MTFDSSQIKRILVIVDESEIERTQGIRSVPMLRAVTIACATGAEIEVFHVVHNPVLEQKLFADDLEVQQLQQRITEERATRLAEISLSFNTNGLAIRHEACFDGPETEAILRKIEDYNPDLVLKRADDDDSLLSFFMRTDTDRALVRESPVPVWFVRDGNPDIRNVLTAIGTLSGKEDIISDADYDIFRYARGVADLFDANIQVIHSFVVPPELPGYVMYGHAIGGSMAHPLTLDQLETKRQSVAKQHRDQLSRFAESSELDPEKIHVVQGNPGEVLPEKAETLGSDLIVMGARNLSHWQRITHRKTAEPVLEKTNCDVLFVKENEDVSLSAGHEDRVSATPSLDIEAAISHPEQVFDSPAEVADNPELSPELRERILHAWDQDIRAQIREEEEGGDTKSIDIQLLGQIKSALKRLTDTSSVKH